MIILKALSFFLSIFFLFLFINMKVSSIIKLIVLKEEETIKTTKYTLLIMSLAIISMTVLYSLYQF